MGRRGRCDRGEEGVKAVGWGSAVGVAETPNVHNGRLRVLRARTFATNAHEHLFFLLLLLLWTLRHAEKKKMYVYMYIYVCDTMLRPNARRLYELPQ